MPTRTSAVAASTACSAKANTTPASTAAIRRATSPPSVLTTNSPRRG
jgi:hypothetical protein